MYHINMYSWFGMLEALTWAGRPGSPATLLMTSHRNMKTPHSIQTTILFQPKCPLPNSPSPRARRPSCGVFVSDAGLGLPGEGMHRVRHQLQRRQVGPRRVWRATHGVLFLFLFNGSYGLAYKKNEWFSHR